MGGGSLSPIAAVKVRRRCMGFSKNWKKHCLNLPIPGNSGNAWRIRRRAGFLSGERGKFRGGGGEIRELSDKLYETRRPSAKGRVS
jgi:hypothetical protein